MVKANCGGMVRGECGDKNNRWMLTGAGSGPHMWLPKSAISQRRSKRPSASFGHSKAAKGTLPSERLRKGPFYFFLKKEDNKRQAPNLPFASRVWKQLADRNSIRARKKSKRRLIAQKRLLSTWKISYNFWLSPWNSPFLGNKAWFPKFLNKSWRRWPQASPKRRWVLRVQISENNLKKISVILNNNLTKKSCKKKKAKICWQTTRICILFRKEII